LCCWCKKPVSFPPVLKYLEMELRNTGNRERLAYYHPHWTRNTAPLLDELGAVIDHVASGSGTEMLLCYTIDGVGRYLPSGISESAP